MPIVNGTDLADIGKLYIFNSGSPEQIGEVYVRESSGDSLIYKAEEVVSRSVTTTQQPTPGYGASNNDYTIPSGYSTITISNFTAGTSYGWCSTEIFVLRSGSVIATLRDVLREWNGTSNNYIDRSNPVNAFTSLQDGDVIRLRVSASYNPAISGQATSTASATYTFT